MSCCRPAVLPPAAHAALGIGPCVVLAHGRGAERRAGLQAGGSGGLVPPPAGGARGLVPPPTERRAGATVAWLRFAAVRPSLIHGRGR